MIVTGRTSGTIKAAQAELGENAIAIHSDATSLSDMDFLVETVRGAFGKLDVLFVNAGLARRVPFEAMTEEVYDEMLDPERQGAVFHRAEACSTHAGRKFGGLYHFDCQR